MQPTSPFIKGPPPPGATVARECLSWATARVSDLRLQPALFVDGAVDLVSACREMALRSVDGALVRDGERLGLLTMTQVRDALLLEQPLGGLPARQIAKFGCVAVNTGTGLLDALRLLECEAGQMLLVREGEGEGKGVDVKAAAAGVCVRFGAGVIALLGQRDLLGFALTHGDALARQIDQADSLEELLAGAARVDAMVALLHKDGARVERIAQRVGDLHTRLFQRLWSLIAPPELQRHSCLIVMGSEGRGEQIVKTDQDNALLLRDGKSFDGLQAVAAEFSAALRRFGYPPCPGNIMLTNALWRQPIGTFKDTLRRWLLESDPQGVMNLAIFLDARAVAGDDDLLLQARRFVQDSVIDNDAFFARFARAAVQFEERRGWWNRLVAGRSTAATMFDLKKLGTFPIVHGARALALQYRIDALNTADRLRTLAQRGVLSESMSRDLTDALHILMGLRMKTNLGQQAQAKSLDNRVELPQLSTLDRAVLQDCLAVIRPFRSYLQRHFSLDALR